MPEKCPCFFIIFYLLKLIFYFEKWWSYTWPIFWGVLLAAYKTKTAPVWSIPADVAYCHIKTFFFILKVCIINILSKYFTFNQSIIHLGCYQANDHQHWPNSSLQCRGNIEVASEWHLEAFTHCLMELIGTFNYLICRYKCINTVLIFEI